MKLNHVGIINRSEDEAVRFYAEFLGMEKLRDFVVGPELSMQLFDIAAEIKVLVFGAEDSKVEVFILPDLAAPSPHVAHFCLYTDHFSEIIKNAETYGVIIIRGDHNGRTVHFLKDFSGNMIELKPQ